MACITKIQFDPEQALPHCGPGNVTQVWQAALNVAKASGKSLAAIPANTPSAPDHSTSADTALRIGLPKGTLVETLMGPTPVEALKARDLLRTGNGHYRPLRHVFRLDHRHAEAKAMIRVKRGALGPNLPRENMRLPYDQKILVQSEIAQHMFAGKGALVAAHLLTSLPDVTVAKPKHCPGTLYLLMLDQHDTVLANGIATETLRLDAAALRTLPSHFRSAMAQLYPGFTQTDNHADRQFRIPKIKRQKRLLQRHAKSNLPLLCTAGENSHEESKVG